MTQGVFGFDSSPDKLSTPPPATDARLTLDEIPRLTRQNGAILEALVQGPVSNAWLSGIALKYTSRISDVRRHVRRHGWDVEAFDRDRERGLCWYRLVRR